MEIISTKSLYPDKSKSESVVGTKKTRTLNMRERYDGGALKPLSEVTYGVMRDPFCVDGINDDSNDTLPLIKLMLPQD